MCEDRGNGQESHHVGEGAVNTGRSTEKGMCASVAVGTGNGTGSMRLYVTVATGNSDGAGGTEGYQIKREATSYVACGSRGRQCWQANRNVYARAFV